MRTCRFDPILQILPSLIPDGFIYLRAQPETCMKRLQVRPQTGKEGLHCPALQRSTCCSRCRLWVLRADSLASHGGFKFATWVTQVLRASGLLRTCCLVSLVQSFSLSCKTTSTRSFWISCNIYSELCTIKKLFNRPLTAIKSLRWCGCSQVLDKDHLLCQPASDHGR